MSLFGQVLGLLRDSEVAHCLIGAAALAAHGVARSTLDLDLLTTDKRALSEPLWEPLEQGGASLDVRRGDAEDPLAGVVRATAPDERAVDVIVGRYSWQSDIVRRARLLEIQGLQVAVAQAADLVLLKLYAAGPQDKWDIELLLASELAEEMRNLVEESLPKLPHECAELWRIFDR